MPVTNQDSVFGNTFDKGLLGSGVNMPPIEEDSEIRYSTPINSSFEISGVKLNFNKKKSPLSKLREK